MDIRTGKKYELDIAHYDLIRAKAMLEATRYLYVGVLCHHTAENV